MKPTRPIGGGGEHAAEGALALVVARGAAHEDPGLVEALEEREADEEQHEQQERKRAGCPSDAVSVQYWKREASHRRGPGSGPRTGG